MCSVKFQWHWSAKMSFSWTLNCCQLLIKKKKTLQKTLMQNMASMLSSRIIQTTMWNKSQTATFIKRQPTNNILQSHLICCFRRVAAAITRWQQTRPDFTDGSLRLPLMWILLWQRATRRAFQPLSGPPSLGCYRPTSDPGSLMWLGRTWRGRAGPKVISRAVTSETNFPTIKEREKLSGLNIARFHGIESNMCVSCTSLPQSLTDTGARFFFPSHPKLWNCKMCLLTATTTCRKKNK